MSVGPEKSKRNIRLEMQQKIDGIAANKELFAKYYRMVQFTVRQQLQSKLQQFLCPLGKNRHLS